MRHRTILAAIALLLAPLALTAQSSPDPGGRHDGPRSRDGRNGHIERLMGYLELSDAQQVQIEELTASHREDSRAGAEATRAIHKTLQEMLESEQPEPAAVGEKMIALHNRRRQLKADQQAHMEALRGLLTPEQVEKFDALVAARQFDRGDRQERQQRGRKKRHGGPANPTDS